MSDEEKKRGDSNSESDDEYTNGANDSCQQCDEYKAGWKRALADYDNLQKNLLQERAHIRAQERERLAYGLMSVLTSFDSALFHRPKELDAQTKNWLQGVLYIRTHLEEVLKELEVLRFGEVGETFDPNQHEAAGEVQRDDRKDQEIVEVIESGWRLGEKILRPARVIVNSLQSNTQSSE